MDASTTQRLVGLHMKTQIHTFEKNEASWQPLRGYRQTHAEENHDANTKYYLHIEPLQPL